MRQISISTDTFAKIWSLRIDGEENEDQILNRLLNARISTNSNITINSPGIFDRRNGVRFEEGFKIFRNYKKILYRAVVDGGVWLLANDESRHRSLNGLNRHIVGGSENAWSVWKFNGVDSVERRIGELRNQNDEPTSSTKGYSGKVGRGTPMNTWLEDVVAALTDLGGKAHLNKIYERVLEIRRQNGSTLPNSSEAIVRRELEYNSSDSMSYQGKSDLFFSVDGLGNGNWGLRSS